MHCDNIHTCRTLPSLLSSCASTVFLCTWATLHLNVPENPNERWLASLWRRIWWTIAALLGPEIILFMAYDDWSSGSRYLIELLEKHPECGWTETHALFVSMGGFRLVNSDGSKKVLQQEEFFRLIREEKLDIPTISLLELQDKSKGDNVAKTIATIQTVWFLLQTLNRAAQELPVTELELTTVAYVAIYLLISFCWWNKPLDVKVPVYVRLRDGKDKEGDDGAPAGEEEQQGLLQKNGETAVEAALDMTHTSQGSSSTMPLLPVGRDVEAQDPSQAQSPRVGALPIRVKLGGLFSNRPDTSMTFWKALCMLLFYIIGGSLFGAIHCIAWNWTKLGTRITKLWRFSAVYVTVFPDAFLVLSPLIANDGALWGAIGLLGYIVARMSLLVLTFMALRSLPYEAYVTPSWTVYIPHIG